MLTAAQDFADYEKFKDSVSINSNGSDNVENKQLQVSGYKLSKIDYEEDKLGFSDLENIKNESYLNQRKSRKSKLLTKNQGMDKTLFCTLFILYFQDKFV